MILRYMGPDVGFILVFHQRTRCLEQAQVLIAEVHLRHDHTIQVRVFPAECRVASSSLSRHGSLRVVLSPGVASRPGERADLCSEWRGLHDTRSRTLLWSPFWGSRHSWAPGITDCARGRQRDCGRGGWWDVQRPHPPSN